MDKPLMTAKTIPITTIIGALLGDSTGMAGMVELLMMGDARVSNYEQIVFRVVYKQNMENDCPR
jgi:hypothetical protein